MAEYYTYKKQVAIKPGERLGFTPGRGYYAIPAPAPAKISAAAKPAPTEELGGLTATQAEQVAGSYGLTTTTSSDKGSQTSTTMSSPASTSKAPTKHATQPSRAPTAAPKTPVAAETAAKTTTTDSYRPTVFKTSAKAKPNSALIEAAHRQGGTVAHPVAAAQTTKPAPANTKKHEITPVRTPVSTSAKKLVKTTAPASKHPAMAAAPTYYTYKKDVHLKPGQTLAYTPGGGYYARDARADLRSIADADDVDYGKRSGVRSHAVQPLLARARTKRELAQVATEPHKPKRPGVLQQLLTAIEKAALSIQHRASSPAARVPRWMLDGEAPPLALVRSKKLPKSLTAAGNPQWRTPAGRERFAFDYLRRTLHLGPNAAAALVGNMSVESRYQTGKGHSDLVPGRWQTNTARSTHVLATGEAGFGIAMWTNATRQEALKTFAGQHVDNFALELAFVAHELKNPQQVVRGEQVNLIPLDTLEKLRHAGSIREATAIVMAVYESPTTYQQVPKQFASVNELLGEFHQGAAAVPTGPNPRDQSGYLVRLAVAKKMKDLYGTG